MNIGRLTVKNRGGDGREPVPDLHAGVPHSGAIEIAAGRSGCRGCVRHFVGPRRHHAHLRDGEAQALGGDLQDFGEQALAHLRAAMIHLDGSIAVHEHHGTRLIEVGRRERDAELHRRHGNPALLVDISGIVAGDVSPPALERGGVLQPVPDARNAIGVTDRRAVVGRVARPVEVALAHDLCRQPELLRCLGEDLFDHQHSLRPAKSAKRRLRRLVGAADSAGDFKRRDLVGIVDVKHRAPHDGLGQIEAPAAVREQLNPNGPQLAVPLETGGVPRQVRMTLPGDGHVELARQPHANRAARLPRPKRGDRRIRVGLHLLPAERAPHPETFDEHLIARHAQHT